jgi:hypothetical protein
LTRAPNVRCARIEEDEDRLAAAALLAVALDAAHAHTDAYFDTAGARRGAAGPYHLELVVDKTALRERPWRQPDRDRGEQRQSSSARASATATWCCSARQRQRPARKRRVGLGKVNDVSVLWLCRAGTRSARSSAWIAKAPVPAAKLSK